MKEFLEVYNEDLEKTGEVIERGTKPKTGYVLASGKHEKLLKECDVYKNLYFTEDLNSK